MAKGIILLSLEGVTLPSGGTGNAAAASTLLESTATATTNTPKVAQRAYAFDAATDEHILFAFILPTIFSSGGVVRLKFRMASATAGNVVLKSAISGVDDGVDDDTTAIFPAPTTATVAVPGVLGQVAEASLSVGYYDQLMKHVLFIGRDADNGSDTATGDLLLLAAQYEFDV
jgi:hypothetical protein